MIISDMLISVICFSFILISTESSARETGAYLRTEPSMGTLSFTKPSNNNVITYTHTHTLTHRHTLAHTFFFFVLFYFLINRALVLC